MLADGGLVLVALYLVGVNIVTAGAFAWDKYQAVHDGWRVPEKTLLTMAAAGGSFGAIFASERLRHKTFKEPFRTQLRTIALVQLLLVVGVALMLGWQSVGG